MADLIADLRTSLLQRVQTDAPRKVWTPTDFLDLGSRDAVDKTLQRLTTAGVLRRIDRGLYDQPQSNLLTQKPSPPDPRSVIDALGRRDQVRMLVDGMTAANDLGLTDAVPAKIVVHTDARRRALRLGNVTISFRPTAASKLHWAGRPGMRVVQALHWLRDQLGREGEAEDVSRKLGKLLDDPATGASLRDDLADGLTTVPTWMQIFLKPLLDGTRTSGSPTTDRDHDRRRPSRGRVADQPSSDADRRPTTSGSAPSSPRTSPKRRATKA